MYKRQLQQSADKIVSGHTQKNTEKQEYPLLYQQHLSELHLRTSQHAKRRELGDALSQSDERAVSYTHLDVYKRQAYQRLRWGRGRKIAEYAVSTMVAMSVIVTLLLELRICFF